MDRNSSNTEEKPGMVSVDITTKDGANAFLEGASCFDFFSTNVKQIRELQKKKRRTFGDEEKLEEFFRLISYVGANTDPELFRAKVPESEIQDWLDLVIELIRSFSAKRSWISTGRLNRDGSRVLTSCIGMFQHAVPVYLAFKSDFFQVLADFIKARKEHGGRALPDVTICCYIGTIVSLSLSVAVVHFDNCWSLEKIFKKFEASGILEEFLRCSTVPQPEGSLSVEVWNDVLKRLVSCPSILTRKFKSGKPCGDTLKAILDGRDGSRDIQSGIWNRLKDIDRLVETLVDTTESINAALPFGTCKCCSKKGNSEAPLSVCSGCRLVSYCSKECQKAHWKVHKEACQKAGKPAVKCAIVVSNFVDQTSETILQAIDEKCNITGVEASDLAVEANFLPNEDGIIPALHDPPMFRVVIIRDYISGQEMPEWLRGNAAEDRHRASFKDWAQRTMAKGRSTTSASLLVHYAGGDRFLPGEFDP